MKFWSCYTFMYFRNLFKPDLFKPIASPGCLSHSGEIHNCELVYLQSRFKKKKKKRRLEIKCIVMESCYVVSLDSDCISRNSFRLCVLLRSCTRAFIPILGALRSSLDFSQSPTQADFYRGMKTQGTSWLSDHRTRPVDRQPLLNTDPHLLLSCRLSTF